MIEPFSRKPTNAREWQLRAQVLQKQLDGLSIEELLRGARFEDASKVGNDDRSYDANQPRVPAGHPDGGQWTSKGGHNAGRTRAPDADHSNEAVISDLDGELVSGAAYASRRARHGLFSSTGVLSRYRWVRQIALHKRKPRHAKKPIAFGSTIQTGAHSQVRTERWKV
jgi:hypothetical protein